ncbi:hypothetical protein AVEN_263900-1 [Araneus ventricosus]|uniref:Uncharacterized protein n=1 Tax=Araneus ventricosus TaxID=182803 RepID=A0A4Y2M3H2_ARAVE|nr:hypothetical protein AVEN_263900-1 [Araneus ventricosus]
MRGFKLMAMRCVINGRMATTHLYFREIPPQHQQLKGFHRFSSIAMANSWSPEEARVLLFVLEITATLIVVLFHQSFETALQNSDKQSELNGEINETVINKIGTKTINRAQTPPYAKESPSP